MGRNRFARVLKFIVFAAVAVLIAGLVVMRLWNWLTPVLFGWKLITFWQGLGLVVLSRILFGGFRGGHGGHWRHRMNDRWQQMSPEDRAKFREGMRGRCGRGHREEPITQPTAQV